MVGNATLLRGQERPLLEERAGQKGAREREARKLYASHHKAVGCLGHDRGRRGSAAMTWDDKGGTDAHAGQYERRAGALKRTTFNKRHLLYTSLLGDSRLSHKRPPFVPSMP